MPTIPLCSYRYDPLDRLTGHAVEAYVQRFYCKSRLATEIDGVVNWSFFQYDEQLLGQAETRAGERKATLLATDQQRSVLHAIAPNESQSFAYSSYGHRPTGNGLLSLLGFNGERPDPVTGHYLLGNGYRAFNPTLMRFNSPDRFSPFGVGGLNAYAYCSGDPINRSDPNGTMGLFKNFSRLFRRAATSRHSTPPVPLKQHLSGPDTLYEKGLRRLRTETDFHHHQVIQRKGWNEHITTFEHHLEGRGPVYKTVTSSLVPNTLDLTGMGYSKITNFNKTLSNRLNNPSLVLASEHLEPYSRVNFYNHIHDYLGNQKMYYKADNVGVVRYVADFNKLRIYNKFLRKAKSGSLQGVDPIWAEEWDPVLSRGDYDRWEETIRNMPRPNPQ